MKRLSALLLLILPAAYAVNVGDSLQQVVAEKGKPKSQLEAGEMRMLTYPDATIKLMANVVVSITAIKPAPAPSVAAAPHTLQNEKTAAVNQHLTQAVTQIQQIVNQPVTALPRQANMPVASVGPVWFHPGAQRPDFANVDVATTQQLPYQNCIFVTSDLNPGIVFLARELEFNANLKLFYADRNLPKKKLNEREMIEINRLFRVIASCEAQLAALSKP